MSELDAKPELQASTTANASGPPGDTGLEAISEKKGEEENGTRAVEEEAEGKRKKQNEGMKMTEAKDVKISEAVDAKAQGVQDVAMMEAVGAKVVEVEEVAMQESEETKTVEGEQVNVQDVEDMKMRETDNIKMLGGEDSKIAEAEDVTMAHAGDVKMIETEDTKKILEAEDVKRRETEAEKMLTSEGAKVLEAEEDTKDQEEKINGEEKEEGMEESMGREGEKSTKKEEDSKAAKGSKKKRVRGKGLGEEAEGKAKKEGVAKEKELLSTPRASSTERPVRERKTVERLVEVLEKEQVKKFVIEKGSGTPLKDIPNVAHKLARKKAADLKLLHQMLFGRIGKAVDFKNHILQFSGFVWHESEEKQKARIKEKLDKYVKDTLLDLCDLFDIPVPKATARKEELVAMLLDFMAAPHATTNVILTEKKQQSTKSRKRKRVGKEGASKISIVIPAKWSRKKRTKNEGTRKAKGKSDYESEDVEEEDKENALPEGDEAFQHSESDKKETEPGEEAEDNENNGGVSRKSKLSLKRSSRRGGSSSTEKVKVISIPKKAVLPSTTRSPPTRLASEQSKADEGKNAGAKVFSRKTKSVDPPKKKSTSSKLEKATGKMAVKGKAKSKETKESGPSKDELRKAIGEILKEVDFNTATFTDILKQLANHYNMDLTPRKASIKIIIQEELTKLADEAEENEEDEAGGTDKDGNPEPRGKEIEA